MGFDLLGADGKPLPQTRQEETFVVVRSTKKAGGIRLRSSNHPTLFLRRASAATGNIPAGFLYLSAIDNSATFEDETSFLVRRNFGGLPMNLKESYNGIQS